MQRGMARREVSMPRPIQLPDKWKVILLVFHKSYN